MRGIPRPLTAALALTALLVLLAALAARQGPARGPGETGEQVIEITARQFAYDPATIRVRAGTRVRLVLRSVDVTHGLAIREYGINLVATPGDAAAATFVADKPGRFPIYCTVYCGTGHPEHQGVLIVEDGDGG